MKIVEAKVGVIGGKLRRSVGNAHQRWTERKSVLIVLRDEEGRIGLGEAAPLPGYSPDTLEDCERALSLAAAQAVGQGPDVLLDTPPSLPAASHALEMAMLDLLSMASGDDMYWSAVAARSLRRCGLIDGVPDTWPAAMQSLRDRGVQAIKVKVGRTNAFQEEYVALTRLREAVAGNWALRLDANGAWSLEEARSHLGVLAPLHCEFVEQPCAPGILERLGPSGTPWAADESLRSMAEAGRLSATGAIFVLKPSILGGIEGCSRRVRPTGRTRAAVISHLFEGPIAMAANCGLALALNDATLAAGLDTHDALSAWPEMPIPQLQTPGLITPASEPGLGFTREQREEIASWIS